MKQEIEKFNKEKKQLLEKVKKIDIFIKSYQVICDHDMQYEGHDSHKDHFKCTICGKTDTV